MNCKTTGIFIVNAPRSGSSVLAGILDKFGIFGGADIVSRNIFNPRGFYESDEIIKINSEIYKIWAKLDPEWVSIISPPKGWESSKEIEEPKNRLKNLLKSTFFPKELWYLKEPSFMRLLPLYFDVIKELALEVNADAGVKVCFVFRHPVEVAYSMHDYNGQSVFDNVFSWLKSNIEAEFATRNIKRTFTSYNAILSDWKETIEKINRELDLGIGGNNYEKAAADAGLLVNPIYRDYETNDLRDISNSVIIEYASKIYNALCLLETAGGDAGDAFAPSGALKDLDEVASSLLELEKTANAVNGKKVLSVPGQLKKVDNAITQYDSFPLIFKKSILYMEPARLSPIKHWHAHIPFAFWLVENQKPGVIVELGLYAGDAYFAFCQAVKQCEFDDFTKCAGVQAQDSKGTVKPAEQNNANAGDAFYEEVLKYNERHYKDFSAIVKPSERPDPAKPLNITIETLRDIYGDIEKIDLLHINGFASYETVKSNFENLEPYLSENGIVLIHFIIPKADNMTTWKFYEETAQKYPSFVLNVDYGLGVILAGKKIQKHPAVSKFVLPAFNNQLSIFIQAGVRLAKKRDANLTNGLG